MVVQGRAVFARMGISARGLFCGLLLCLLACHGASEEPAGAPSVPAGDTKTVLLPADSVWKYLDDGSDQGTAWRGVGFDDSTWASGPAQLGYGDDDEATVVSYGPHRRQKHITTYFRKTIQIADARLYDSLSFELLRDDGAVVYVNGIEVLRDNLPGGAINYQTKASRALGSAMENEWAVASVPSQGLLVDGDNVIAVEVHQINQRSRDVSFNLRITGVDESADEPPLPPPPAPLTEPGVLIAEGSVWKYLDDGSDQGTVWIDASFDDSNWASGPAQLGYGDGDEATVVSYGPERSSKYITTYFRHTFEISAPVGFQWVDIDLISDDGAVVYMNGIEVMRESMPSGPIDYSTPASRARGNGTESDWKSTRVAAQDVLLVGPNTVAVEVHQHSRTSSDISFDLRVTGTEPLGSVVRGPYLQRGSSDSVVVRWRTNTPTDSRVDYGTAPGVLNNTVSMAGETREHEVVLTGLSADTTYYYAVGHSGRPGGDADSVYTFKTAPPVGTARDTRIWVLGDSGTANTNAAQVRDAFYAWSGSPSPDLWLMLGDNAYDDGTDSEYQTAVFDMYPETLRSSVLWPTFGNHDGHSADSDTSTGPYYDIFTLPETAEAGGVVSDTEAYYSFDYGNIHFICLDSYDSDRSLGGAMLTWLQADLAVTNADWIIAYWHHPPYSKGSHDSDTETRMIQMRENALPILEYYGVDLVLTGHSHSYERSWLLDGHYGFSNTLDSSMILDSGDGRMDGTGAYVKPGAGRAAHRGAVYITAGSSAKLTSAPLDHPAMYISLLELGSVVIDVQNGRMHVYFIDDTGSIRDYWTIDKTGSAQVAASAAN